MKRGRRLEDLDLLDVPLPDLGWNSYLDLDAAILRSLDLDLDDDPAFARFANVLRNWDVGRLVVDGARERKTD